MTNLSEVEKVYVIKKYKLYSKKSFRLRIFIERIKKILSAPGTIYSSPSKRIIEFKNNDL